jgi:hypothetical protein
MMGHCRVICNRGGGDGAILRYQSRSVTIVDAMPAMVQVEGEGANVYPIYVDTPCSSCFRKAVFIYSLNSENKRQICSRQIRTSSFISVLYPSSQIPMQLHHQVASLSFLSNILSSSNITRLKSYMIHSY